MAEEELSTVTDTSPAQPAGTSCGGKQDASHEIYCTVKEMYHPVIPVLHQLMLLHTIVVRGLGTNVHLPIEHSFDTQAVCAQQDVQGTDRRLSID